MNIDSAEDRHTYGRDRRSHLMVATLRLKFLGSRYPSASQSLLSIVDQAVVSGTSFLTAAIIGRLSSPGQLGLYYLGLSIVLIISGIQEQVIAGPYMVLSKHRRGGELDEYTGSMLLHHLVLTALTTGGLAVVAVICHLVGNKAILPGLWALLGAGPLILLRDGMRRFTFAKLRMTVAIALDATVAAAQIGGLLLLGFFGYLSLWSIFSVMGGACAAACLVWYLLDPPQLRLSRKRFVSDWRHNWTFGQWTLWSYLTGGTASYVMLWILGLTIDPTATAMLGACTTIVGVTNVVMFGMSNVLTPLAAHSFAAGGPSELRRILSSAAVFLTVVIGSFCLLVLLTGDGLVVLVFGPHYHGTGAILLTLASGAVMAGLGTVAGNGLWAIGQTRPSFAADVCGMLATLIGAAVLIHPFGVLGAALAIFSGISAAAVARMIILIRHFSGGSVRVNEQFLAPVEEKQLLAPVEEI